MSMSTEEIWRAVATERTSLADLLAELPESAWNVESLCAGWRVRDVVAHLILATRATLGWILVNLPRAGFDIDRGNHDTAVRLADRVDTAQLLAEFRATVPSRFTPIRTTPADRLMDTLVHGQDIAIPLGITREMPAAAARTALIRVWEAGAQFRIQERLSGFRLEATDTDWSTGDGRIIRGTTGALLLLATSRAAAYPLLTGPGSEALTAG